MEVNMLIMFFIGCLGCSEEEQDSAAPQVEDTAPESESEDSSSPEDTSEEEDTSEAVDS